MPRFHVHDNARRATVIDQEEGGDTTAEILQRLDRIEQAIMVLIGGDNGNGEAEADQAPQPTTTTPASELRSGQRMGDTMIEKGNLSRVDPEAHDPGMRWPEDKGGKGLNYTGDSYQTMRDKFLSRNASHPGVVDINSRNKAFYNR